MKKKHTVNGFLKRAKYYFHLGSLLKDYEKRINGEIIIELHGLYYEDNRPINNSYYFNKEKQEHIIVFSFLESRKGGNVGTDQSAENFYKKLRDKLNSNFSDIL